jgi:hypothetical protein
MASRTHVSRPKPSSTATGGSGAGAAKKKVTTATGKPSVIVGLNGPIAGARPNPVSRRPEPESDSDGYTCPGVERSRPPRAQLAPKPTEEDTPTFHIVRKLGGAPPTSTPSSGSGPAPGKPKTFGKPGTTFGPAGRRAAAAAAEKRMAQNGTS